MSTNELNIFLNTFDRPAHFSDVAWNQVLTQAKRVWESYLRGEDWRETLEITCKEAYLMLVSKDGKLIVSNDGLFQYAKNEHVVAWRKHLEDVAFSAIRNRQFDKAERFFGKALKLDGSNAMNYYRRSLLRMKALRHKEALDDITKAIEINPNVPVFYLKRSTIFRLIDLDYKAMSDINKAIKLDPGHAEAYEIRGKFRMALGDRAGAKSDLIKGQTLRNQGQLGKEELYTSRAA